MTGVELLERAYLVGAAVALVAFGATMIWRWYRYPATREDDPLCLACLAFSAAMFWPLLALFAALTVVLVVYKDRAR